MEYLIYRGKVRIISQPYSFEKEIIKYNLRLDAVAVHILLYTVCCNHSKVQCLFCLGLVSEYLDFVTEALVIILVDCELSHCTAEMPMPLRI